MVFLFCIPCLAERSGVCRLRREHHQEVQDQPRRLRADGSPARGLQDDRYVYGYCCSHNALHYRCLTVHVGHVLRLSNVAQQGLVLATGLPKVGPVDVLFETCVILRYFPTEPTLASPRTTPDQPCPEPYQLLSSVESI